MQHTYKYTLSLHALNDFGLLPRIGLHFSRRRLKIDRFEMVDAGDPGLACFTIALRCDAPTLERLIKQLQKIIGLQDISVSAADSAAEEEFRPPLAKFA